jgi:ubiquinone/menaquinone biosynthesis C-methylase UbiE
MTFAGDAALVVGMDVSMGHLSAMRRNLDTTTANSLFGVCIDGSEIPSQDATYDLVVSFEVLEHVQDERRTLQEIFRVLKPAGEFILTVPNKWWIFETHGARLPWLKWNRVPFFSWLPTRLHRRWAMARIYRRGEILSLLASSGFDIIASAYVTAPLDVLRSGPLQAFLRKTVFHNDSTAFPVFATAIFVHCRKSGGG